ncbi:MAG: hypothetical protein NUW24_03165 [Anaerolineae bacterium]|jgi:hypothetical protein|nr:hypothetical protein [Anaerolineae bacterium]MDH7473413.1 hypothetical protein [Anaerolineae bacterium]
MSTRTRIFIFGGVAGALLGLLAAWLYVREAESAGVNLDESSTEITPRTGLQVGLGILGVLRQIANLGRPG